MRPAHSLRTVSRRRVSGLDIRDGDDRLKASSPVSPPSPITEVDNTKPNGGGLIGHGGRDQMIINSSKFAQAGTRQVTMEHVSEAGQISSVV